MVLDPDQVTHNQWREGFRVQLEPFFTFNVSVSKGRFPVGKGFPPC